MAGEGATNRGTEYRPPRRNHLSQACQDGSEGTAGGQSQAKKSVRLATGGDNDISKERVIGSNLTFETQMTDEGPVVVRKAGLVDPIDDGPGKPINIELHIGRKPVIAGGNSDGDLHMLWLAQTGVYPSLSLLVNHDDAVREYAYDIGSEKTLQMAPQRGWTVVSMKNDWNRIFAWA